MSAAQSTTGDLEFRYAFNNSNVDIAHCTGMLQRGLSPWTRTSLLIAFTAGPVYLSNSADKHFNGARSLMRTHHLKNSGFAGGGSHWRGERARIRF
jgi:hypothetical protein